MGTRPRLQEHMEHQARKKQQEFERREGWMVKTQYYEHWGKQNNKYGDWTSDNYYRNSLTQYDEEKKKKEKEEALEKRRDKLRQVFDEDKKEFGMEILESPRNRKSPRNDIPTEVLKDINIGLKLAEGDKRSRTETIPPMAE